MNREKLSEFFKVWNNGTEFKVGKTKIKFARQDMSDVEEIEKMSNKNLISEWKSLVHINEILGQVSMNEMQRIILLEMEICARDIDKEELTQWYKRTREAEEESDLND